MNLYGMQDKNLNFSDEEIANLFGHEAAEDENPDRLKEYYFKNDVYDQITADLPLRLVVGHKGIGKSGVFKVAQQELCLNHIGIVNISAVPKYPKCI